MLQELISKFIDSLKENERSILISIIVYSFIAYTVLFISFDEFKILEWYQEIILSVGSSVVLMIVGLIFYPKDKGRSNPYYVFALMTLVAIAFATYRIHPNDKDLIVFFLILIAPIILLVWCPFAINWCMRRINKMRKTRN